MTLVKLVLIILGCGIGIVVLTSLIKGIILSKHKFICSQCNKEFYPKWYKIMFEQHFNDYYKIKCPHCGEKQFNRSGD